MGDSQHCRCLHGFILLVVMFLISVFSLASKMDVSSHGDQKRSLSSSINSSLSESVEYTMCANHREAKDGINQSHWILIVKEDMLFLRSLTPTMANPLVVVGNLNAVTAVQAIP
ncbi:unnamed protein product [Arabidopsis lyrata]|nr:unnamed protein product [Arabidopsis lyrata]